MAGIIQGLLQWGSEGFIWLMILPTQVCQIMLTPNCPKSPISHPRKKKWVLRQRPHKSAKKPEMFPKSMTRETEPKKIWNSPEEDPGTRTLPKQTKNNLSRSQTSHACGVQCDVLQVWPPLTMCLWNISKEKVFVSMAFYTSTTSEDSSATMRGASLYATKS